MEIKENKEMFKWNGRLTGYAEREELMRVIRYEKAHPEHLSDYQALTLDTRDKYVVQSLTETKRVLDMIRTVYDERTCRMMRERYVNNRSRKEVAASSYMTLRQQGYLEKKVLTKVFEHIAREDGITGEETENGLQ